MGPGSSVTPIGRLPLVPPSGLLGGGRLGLLSACLGKQLAVVVSPRPGLGSLLRSTLPLLELSRLLMGTDGPLQGLDLMLSSLNQPVGIRRHRRLWSGPELLGALVDLLGPPLDLLGPLDQLLDLVAEVVTHGRLQATVTATSCWPQPEVLGQLTTAGNGSR